MSERSSRSGLAVTDEVDVHLTVFLATLTKAGYAEKTQHDKERLVVPFIRWAREAGIAVADIDEAQGPVNASENLLFAPERRVVRVFGQNQSH